MQAPAQVPGKGLTLWLNAGLGAELSGDEVLRWEDARGGGPVAVTQTTSRPRYVKDRQYGFGAIAFNGIMQGLKTGPLINFPNKRGTLVIVAKILGRSHSSGAGFSSLVSTYYGSGHTWQLGSSANYYSYFDGEESHPINHESVWPGNWNILCLTRDSDEAVNILFNNGNHSVVSISPRQPDINAIKIGFNDSAETTNGLIAEILLYDHALEEKESNQLHQYLSDKYHIDLAPPPVWKTWWFYLLLLALLIAATAGVTRYLSQRKLRIRLQQLQRQQDIDRERLRISREMHDDIGSGLTQIVLMSESLRHKAPEEKANGLAEIADASRKLVDSMADIIWSMRPENKSTEQLAIHLREMLSRMLENAGIDYRFGFTNRVPDKQLASETSRNILLVCKESINNVIKYSHASLVTVSFHVTEEGVNASINDNGQGFDPAKAIHGSGIRNIRQRIAESGGKLEVLSSPGSGTQISFYVPFRQS